MGLVRERGLEPLNGVFCSLLIVALSVSILVLSISASLSIGNGFVASMRNTGQENLCQKCVRKGCCVETVSDDNSPGLCVRTVSGEPNADRCRGILVISHV